VLAIALMVPTGLLYGHLHHHYDPDNPLLPAESFFDRMHQVGIAYPQGIVAFLKANDVHGRVIQEWRWEGYLRWKVPELKLYIGGRAQQVYPEEVFAEQQRILRGYQSDERLRRLGVQMVMGPANRTWLGLARRLIGKRDSTWAYVYHDGADLVVVDMRRPEMRRLAQAAAAGRLAYPSPGVKALSVAFARSSPAVASDVRGVMDAVGRANAIRPTAAGYGLFARLVRLGYVNRSAATAYLERERDRLADIPLAGPRAVRLLAARIQIASELASLHLRAGRPTKQTAAQKEVNRLEKQLADWRQTYQ
jgi:hypothetical protein